MPEKISAPPNYSLEIKKYLIEQFELSHDQLDEMLPLFVETVHAHMKNLEEIFECGDLPAMRKMGHTMKGALLNLGLDGLAELAMQIEFHPEENGDLERCKSTISSLRKEVDCIQTA